MRSTATRRARFVVPLSLLVLAANVFTAPVTAAETPPGECATIMAVDDVRTGMVGTGWTVAVGRTRSPFSVEVLGVLANALGPGRDMILVEASDVAGSDIIANAGGIWSGMSGSPVYIEGKLVGAVAWGLRAGPSPIGGLTPAEDMVKVLGYPGAATSTSTPSRVALSADARHQITARTGLTLSASTSLSALRVPLSVSGVPERGRARLQAGLDQAGIEAFVTPGSAARPRYLETFSTPQPGGNFAAMLSYGDLTFGGIGTTTYVCDGTALAFGHPLLFDGRSALGASDASALAIVASSAYGPFKVARIRNLFGVLDQDRRAAVRAQLGVTPTLVPVRSRVEALDLAAVRTGRTYVTKSEYVADIAPFHLLANVDSVIDRVGRGTSTVRWTVRGKRANGDPWMFSRSNRYASTGDIAEESVMELFTQLAAIDGNPFEKVTFDEVYVSAAVDDTYESYGIESIKVSKNGGRFRTPEILAVAPGDSLVVRVGLRRYRSDLVTVDVPVRVPATAQGEGLLQVTGGGGWEEDFPCLFDHDECGGATAASFPELLTSLASGAKNHDLRAELLFGGWEDGEVTTTGSTKRLDAVVGGSARMSVIAP